MHFFYETKTNAGYRCAYLSRVFERYDSNRKKHIFLYDFEGDKGKQEIMTVDPVTKEIEWVNNSMMTDDEVKSAIRDFKDTVCFALGNNDRAKEWLKTEIDQFIEIGFNNEIVICVNGKNIGADRIFWIVKRIFTLDDDERINSEPLIVVRAESYAENDYNEYQSSDEEYKLYLNEEGVFNHEAIFKALWKDISKTEPEIYNIGLDYRPTIDYRRYV